MTDDFDAKRRPTPTIDLKAGEFARAPEPAATSQAEPEPPIAEPPASDEVGRKGGFGWIGHLAAGVAGGVVALAGAWIMTPVAPPAPPLPPPQTVTPAGVDPAKIDDLTTRLAALEAAAKRHAPPPTAPAPDPALTNRLGSAEATVKAMDQNIADLNRRGDEFNAALRDLRERVNSNANAVTELARKEALPPPQTPDRDARLALATANLRAKVERGEPFAADLAAAEAYGASPQTLADLRPFAATGVPLAAKLASEFTAVATTIRQAMGETTAESGGLLDRLQANAEKLVRVRPADQPSGDDPRALLGRIEAKAAADPASALPDLARLTATQRAPAEAWIKAVTARQRAVDASRTLASDAIAAIAKPAASK